ncbi:MAG: Ig-like domain-containing protein, partial [Bacteroidales bacterium]|nr:Ig-like domain-containing protein [Bacteroidales bacterium]
MKNLYNKIKKTALLAAIWLTTAAGAYGATTISGLQGGTNGYSTQTISTDYTFGGNVEFRVASGETLTLTGTLTGMGFNFTKSGAGTLILTNNANNGIHNFTISAGKVLIGNGGTTGWIGVVNGENYTVSIASGCELVINNDGSWNYMMNFSGSGTIRKKGSGYVNLTKSVGVALNIETGRVHIGSNSSDNTTATLTKNAFVYPGATLRFYRSDTYTYSGLIAGEGNVGQYGAGELILTGANSYTGTTTIASGTTLTVGNGTSGVISGNSQIINNGTFHFHNEIAKLELNAAMTGTGNVIVNGGPYEQTDYLLFLNSNNTCSGTLTIVGGGVSFGDFSRTINAGVNFSSIVLENTNSGLHWYVPAENVTSYNGSISGNGVFRKCELGKLILTNNCTYTGSTYVERGELELSGNGSIGNTKEVVLNTTTSHLIFNRSSGLLFGKVISGLGKVSVKSSFIDYMANNTYTGGTTIESGACLTLGHDTYYSSGAFGYAYGSVSDIGGIVNNGQLIFYRSIGYTYSGTISGTGVVINMGTGKITLNGNNTYTGSTSLFRGTLALGTDGTIESSFVTFFDYAKFSIAANKTIKGLLSISGSDGEVDLGTNTLTIGHSGQADGGGTYAGKITGTGSGIAINKYGTEVLKLTGTASTYTGTTDLQGPVEFSSDSSLGASNIRFYAGGLLRWASGNTADMSARITYMSTAATLDVQDNDVIFANALPTGSSAINKAGSGSLRMTANNTRAGGLNVLGGSLYIGNNTAAGNYAGNINLANGCSLFFNRNNAVTYSGSISGAGAVTSSNGEVTLSGGNTFTGGLFVNSGIVRLTGTISNACNITIASGAIMEFSRSVAYTYAGQISGAGAVSKSGVNVLTLSGENTYTGETTISAGTLKLDATGTIAKSSGVSITGKFQIEADKTIKGLSSRQATSEIVLNGGGILTIDRFSGDQTFAGTISGSGGLTKKGFGITIGKGGLSTITTCDLTLSGINSYWGATTVEAGTLILASGGTLPNSAVTLGRSNLKTIYTYGNLDVSSENKKLSSLSAGYANNTVALGSTVLQIGTGAATADGGGDFKGKFTGTGGMVAKAGEQTFTMTGANTATGTFSLAAGTLQMGGTWAGSLLQHPGTTLEVQGTATIGGNLQTTGGGTIVMDLTAATPSLLNITGALQASNTTTLNITANASNNQVLMNAASGISTGLFSISTPGLTTSLSAIGQTQLLLNATTADTDAPTIGTALATGAVTPETVALSWGAASDVDNVTPQANLTYTVYCSTENNIGTVAQCNANPLLALHSGQNLISYMVTGLEPNTTYYFNVVVNDQAGNKAAYTVISKTTAKATLDGAVLISGSAVFNQTLTADVEDLTSTPSISDLGILTYQWKRDGNNITGATSSTYTLQPADIGSTITVTVTAANTNGSITSVATDIVDKISQTEPDAPTLLSKTSFSITLNTIEGCEYRLTTSDTWQSSTTFSGLMPDTYYQFYARKAGTATHYVSPESDISEPILTVPDNAPTIPTGTGALTAGTATPTFIPLTWGAAADDVTPQASLQYFVYYSTSNNIATIADCATNGTLANPGWITGITSCTVTGLVPNTAYYFNVVVKDDADNAAAYTSVSKTTAMLTLVGEIGIDGSTIYGTRLVSFSSCSTVPAGYPVGTLFFQWNRDGVAISGATTSTYTLQAEDIGSMITVTLTSSNTPGGITSAAVGPVEQASQTAPAAPTLASKTYNSITLNTIAGAEYQIAGAPWQTSTTFTGLTPGTTYIFYARMAETATHHASPISVETTIATDVIPAVTSVTVSPATANVQKGNTRQFSANVETEGNASTDVTWSIVETHHANTTISANGLLTIASTETATTLTIRATSYFNATHLVYGEATVTVTEIPVTPQVISVTVSPTTATVQKGNTRQFTANVETEGNASTDVTWSIVENHHANTTISANGLLTIATEETATTLTIRATSYFNATHLVYGEAMVTVTDIPSVTSVTVSPATATVQKGSEQWFEANVETEGNASTDVTWSIMENHHANTTISANGLLTIATEETATTLTIRATSYFNATHLVYGEATVTVTEIPITPQVISVTVSPATATVQKGNTRQFTAIVETEGNASTDVTWTIVENHHANTTISANGLLTIAAEETATTLTIRATSNFNTTHWIYGNATVNILDITPPTIPTGTGALTAGTATTTTVPLSWGLATDDITPQASLHYTVYYSALYAIGTVESCEVFGTVAFSGTNINSFTVSGLEPNINYCFNVVVRDADNNATAYTQVQKTTEKATLGGTITIMGDAIVKEELKVDVSGLTTSPPNATLGTLFYEWTYGYNNSPIGWLGWADNCIVSSAAIDRTITVKVWATNTKDSVWATTDIIVKISQTAPEAPTLEDKTRYSITLNTIEGCEYRLATSDTWQTSTTFTGLTPNTYYQFYARKAETATHYASPESDISEPILTVPDNAPTIPTGTGALAAGTPTATTVPLSWGAATDDVTPQASLAYTV